MISAGGDQTHRLPDRGQAAATVPLGPLVLFPAGGHADDREIVSGMRDVLDAGRYPVAELATDDPLLFAAAFSAKRSFLLVDVHSYMHPDSVSLGWENLPVPPLGARVLVLGSCQGAQPRLVHALSAGLVRPTPVLACTADVALFSHGPALWPHVLKRVPDLAAATDPAEAEALLNDAVTAAHSTDRRRHLDQKWTARVLHPQIRSSQGTP